MGAAPRGRGSAVARWLAHESPKGRPARAGVCPKMESLRRQIRRPPRQGGGLPNALGPGRASPTAAPRGRGFAGWAAASPAAVKGRPARAGVCRRTARRGRQNHGPPRQEGGLPIPPSTVIRGRTGAPPERGSALDDGLSGPDWRKHPAPTGVRPGNVFTNPQTRRPARTGIRHTWTISASRIKAPPRADGDPPENDRGLVRSFVAAPRGRGSAEQGPALIVAGGDRPARTGIRRTPSRSPGHRGWPPRADGDPPIVILWEFSENQAAPRGRGSAVRGALSNRPPWGRPARTGICRHSDGGNTGGFRPPRADGGLPNPHEDTVGLTAATPRGRGSAQSSPAPLSAGGGRPARTGICLQARLADSPPRQPPRADGNLP